jgi:iron complex outermembrane receptor protein
VLDGNLTTELDLGFATLTSYSLFQNERTQQQTDLDGTSTKITNISSWTNSANYSQEFVLRSNSDGPLTWIAGANFFYQLDDAPDYRLATNANPNPTTARKGKIVTRAYAAFADGTWEFTPGWFLTGGLRYSLEVKDFKFNNAARARVTNTDAEWNSLTPRLILRHEFDPNTSAYASFSKGFKSGTFNASSPSLVPVDPEKITAFEIGYKMARPGFSWNNSAYHYTYKDMQVSSYDFTAATPVTRLQNVGKATIYGVDTDLTWFIDDNWDVVFTGAWTHARYDEFPGAIAYFPNLNGIAYRTVSTDVSGRQMTRSPDWTASVTLNYTLPTDVGTFKFSAHPYYTSEHYTELATQFKIKQRTLLDLTATWTSPDDKWRVLVQAKNVFDKYYISYWDPVGTALMVNDGPPRQVRASLSYAF